MEQQMQAGGVNPNMDIMQRNSSKDETEMLEILNDAKNLKSAIRGLLKTFELKTGCLCESVTTTKTIAGIDTIDEVVIKFSMIL